MAKLPELNENCPKIIETKSPMEHSDPELLEIDLKSTISPHKSSTTTTNDVKDEASLFEVIEEEMEKKLTEKAEKTNLTVMNVKTIIKEILINEHVKTLLHNEPSDDNDDNGKMDLSLFGTKLTRAKTKELLTSQTIQIPQVNIPWVPQPPPSETQVLIGEELIEEDDDSEDEYLPVPEEESEDDKESDINSLPPPTPPTPLIMEDHSTQTTVYTDDGVFKLPPPITVDEEPASSETTNIALRTRSKINLSSTPLEEIEKNFIPPDVTTDMYDNIECEDDEWTEFLKRFTEPLEEIIKPTEDEEHDPEYNIMADDQIDHVDNEDFRIDKAVKISKKEVKELWEELFEYVNNCADEYDGKNKQGTQNIISEILDGNLAENVDTVNSVTEEIKKPDNIMDISIEYHQLCVIEQQMRQHVQMLTQNFILTYQHPEFHTYSLNFKEYLLNLKFLSDRKSYSVFKPVNLPPALNLITSWEELCNTNNDLIKSTREHTQQELLKATQSKMSGNFTYILTFPKLILETISQSEVFLFPSLLPKIPFKPQQFATRRFFTNAEDSLLAFALDHFKTFLIDDKKRKVVHLKEMVTYVKDFVMPHREIQTILKHVNQCKHPRCATNPIQQYILHKKITPIVHYLYPLNQILPPCKRRPEELPIQWKNYIFPPLAEQSFSLNGCSFSASPTTLTAFLPQQIILLNNNSPSPCFSNNRSPILLGKPIELLSQSETPKRTLSRRKSRIKNNLNHGSHNSSSGSVILSFEIKNCSPSAKVQPHLSAEDKFVKIFLSSIQVQKLIKFLAFDEMEAENNNSAISFSLPNLNESIIIKEDTILQSNNSELTPSAASNDLIIIEELNNKTETVTSNCMRNEELKKLKATRNLEFSTITSSSFQKENTSSEVEFCRNSYDIQICQTSQFTEHEEQLTINNEHNEITPLIESSITNNEVKTVTTRKKATTTSSERKKNKLRKEFLANLSVATPDDPEAEKLKNEKFALSYYDKLKKTLESEDYSKVMQILNDFDSGDVVDLYKDVQIILRPKYVELAEDFLFFLHEKEANAVGQLIPWLELQGRVKFLRKLEIFFKDQPAQLKRIYNTFMEFTTTENLAMDKIKSVILPMLKGNQILIDLFLQNFKDERPPSSLLEGPYEKIDVNKELIRPEDEEFYETFIVPNTEDKYGGQNCICHCHKIADNEYKSRYKHCHSCGLKFANGKLYLSTGRMLRPATVTFKTNPELNHNKRLIGKQPSSTSLRLLGRKKRRDSHKTAYSKDHVEEDTEDEESGKRKRSGSQKTPRKRRKLDVSKTAASSSPKKSPARNNNDNNLDSTNNKSRKRGASSSSSCKKFSSKKELIKKTEPEEEEEEEEEEVEIHHHQAPEEEALMLKKTTEQIDEEKCRELGYDYEIVAISGENEQEINEETQVLKSSSAAAAATTIDDCGVDSSGESIEKPPSTPDPQTAESETDAYLEEESSQDNNYESDESSLSGAESTKGSQSDSNTNDERAWQREEDTIILETLQKEDDKEYALQVISDKLPNRSVSQIRSRLSRLMGLLIETLKNT